MPFFPKGCVDSLKLVIGADVPNNQRGKLSWRKELAICGKVHVNNEKAKALKSRFGGK